MLEERICGVIGAEGHPHGGNGDLGLAIVPDEGDDFFADVAVEHGLDVAAMERVRGFVVEGVAVDGVYGEEFYFAGIDKIGEGADHALALKLKFITGTGGESEKRRSPVAVDDDAQ